MKRLFKIMLLLLVVVLSFGIGFIVTLQLFEFRPEETKTLDIRYISSYDDQYLSSSQTIKLLTFNTGYASLSETEDFVMDGGQKGRMDSAEEVEANMEGIKAILEREAADIILLQEVDVDSHRSYNINQYEYYESELLSHSVLAYNYRVIFVPFPLDFSQMMGKVNSGITTMSQYVFEDASRVQLPGEFSWPLRLANLKRCLLMTRFPIEGSEQELVVINVHLSAYDDGSMRAVETEALREIMLAEYQDGNYVVVGGDFNQTFPDAVTIDDGSGSVDYLYPLKDPNYWQAPPIEGDWFIDNGFNFAIDVTTPTCRLLHQPYDTSNELNNQYYLIDGFIVSSNIAVQSVITIDESFKYSDHNPVVIEINLS